MNRLPAALLVAPIAPDAGGNGLAMRAGTFLEAAAADHEVTLLHVPLLGGGGPADFVLRRVRRFAALPLGDALDPLFALCAGLPEGPERWAALRGYPRPSLCRWATSPALAAARAAAGDARFDLVVVLRSYLAAYAAPFLGAPARCILDLDDDEPLTQRRLSALHARGGRPEEARWAAAEADKYAAHEAAWLPRFDVVLAASEVHAAAVRARHPGVAVALAPNTVAVPATATATAAAAAAGRDDSAGAPRAPAMRLLFVGNLSYEPNVEAALWLGGEIIPLLHAGDGRPVELRIAGARPAAAVAALAGPGIEVIANPADLAPHYAWADAALAPIRAGGGTRIKILEAFAAGVPVVATAMGAEGLAAADGEHLLLAEDAAGLAAACRRLRDEPRLAAELVANALDLVRRSYSRPAGVARLRAIFQGAAL